MARPDDAGVYRLTDELALVQTVDFFTPIVDDPYTFGQVAVANALSDVYAMGGCPLTAMNIVGFPKDKLDLSVLGDILRGGQDKLREAEVALVGGHSIADPELKFGVSVTGVVHPDQLWTNLGARAGDRVVLTKPLGTGIVNTALKAKQASAEAVTASIDTMRALNRDAAEIAREFDPHACTDVTGFGLVGHAVEMLDASGLCLRIDTEALPRLPEVDRYSNQGLMPGGLHRNRDFYKERIRVEQGVAQEMLDLVFDPQTSGGLLIAVAPQDAETMVARMNTRGVSAAIIGEIIDTPDPILIELARKGT